MNCQVEKKYGYGALWRAFDKQTHLGHEYISIFRELASRNESFF